MTTAVTPLHGPDFSSYAPDEVSWLLTDLSRAALEAPVAERERAIQSGAAHYAESLPEEYRPSPEYLEVFHAALDRSADRVALAVGVVTELVLRSRPRPVFASLARAGTPIGILMRRWARFAAGLEVPHYTVSIVRGRGIDRTALRFLARHHDPASVVFVDGWTGKGAICRELHRTLAGEEGFDASLAVLADPGHCTPLFGTRDDFLIPSACLNSTVSGLVSRTVLNERLIAPDEFHGAKFYRELEPADVSAVFLDRVTARFGAMADEARATASSLWDEDRTADWRGWHTTVDLCRRYGLADVNLLKPGIGETTRVLLRRVPWRVLVRAGAGEGADLAHVRLLAAERDVPVDEVEGLPYRCVGLIRPLG